MALKGINLGGWLVSERWMTPELYGGVTGDGERAIGRELGATEAASRLRRHRDTFITEKDFKWIKAHGFDFVRLPVGYWLFEEAEGYVSGKKYVDKAFTWAETNQLGIVLDFHGLQGSQNGHDHSGEVGKVRLFRKQHRQSALRTMERLAREYGQREALIGMELINEPKARWFLWRLLRFYDKAYEIAQQHVKPEAKIIVSDAFKPLRMAKALARRGYGDRLVLDVHLYGVFGKDDQKLTYEQHVQRVQTEWQPLIRELQQYVPEIYIGEWSGGLPGPVYLPGTETAEKVESYITIQEKVFNDCWGYSYWSYKTPGWGAWDYRTLPRNRLK